LAKKRRQKIEKKDDLDLKLPEFDEHQFIDLELRKAKLSLIAFIFALVMVFITYQLYLITYPDARGPIVLGLFAVLAVPFIINQLKIDISDFEWKNWIGVGAIYVMSWLAIFILLCNPPFSDFIEPELDEDSIIIHYVKSGDNSENWIEWNTTTDPQALISPIKIRISVKIYDNSEVDKDSVKITIKDLHNTTITRKMTYVSNDQFRVILENDGEVFTKSNKISYTVEFKDVKEHENKYTGIFQII